PGKVTIFGESAGGMSVTTLLAMPRARGLFHRVIAQSGAGYHAISLETSRLMGQYIAEKLGVEPTPEAFASQPGAHLIKAQVALATDIATRHNPQRWREVSVILMPHEPVIDGDTLPDLPIKLIAAGAGAGIDVMVGTNTDEYHFFLVPGGVIDLLGENALVDLSMGYGVPLEELLSTYRDLHPGARPGELFATIVTD